MRHDAETGETDCVGGTGKCSCEEPYFGGLLLAALREAVPGQGGRGRDARGSAFQVAVRGDGLESLRGSTEPHQRRPAPAGSIPGDSFSVAASAFGVAYVVFSASEDAMVARPWTRFIEIPSPVAASRARQGISRRNSARWNSAATSPRSFRRGAGGVHGPGACDYGAGECYCASRYFGPACEYTYCAKDCAGHGRCDFVTGRCECEDNYQTDQFEGCKLRALYLASTTCEDAAMDKRVDASGRRVVPLQLSCVLGVDLGSKAFAEHCPRRTPSRGEGRLLHALPRVRHRIRGGGGGDLTGTLVPTVHPVCSDCSGYDEYNVSQIHLYPEEPCRSVLGRRSVECVEGRVASDVVRGLGMLPPATPRNPRRSPSTSPPCDARYAIHAILRATGRRPQVVSLGGGGGAARARMKIRCAGEIEVFRDGVAVYSAVVPSRGEVEIDVRNASTLTLRTATVEPTYWRLGGG